jgi:predicted metal-dependent HD superfamily phosphohydrolase
VLPIGKPVPTFPEAHYGRYAAAIRREYAHVPDEDYRAGRRRVLESFLARPSVFIGADRAALWETSARANLVREIAQLSRRA